MLRERRRHAHYKLNTRLDRKSSRGMIYENEELRLRTININAEVERGQSDIKRLRRENEQLRREIWTLRDECDRLNKRVKAKLSEYEHGGCSARASGGSGGCTHRGSNGACDGMHSQSNSEDSDSCDTCRGDFDEPCNEECCQERCKQPIVEEPVETQSGNMLVNNVGPITVPNCEEPLGPHSNFDHLSVVSEETLSSSDVLAPPQSEHLLGYSRDNNSSPHSIQSLIGPLTPLTPIELVANQLNDLQAVVPPLSYFENIVQQQHMGSNIGQTPACSSTDVTMRHTNGWDYNIESPFAQRKGHNKAPPAPAGNTAAHSRSPNLPPRHIHVPALTTFGPTSTNISAGINTTDSTKPAEIMAHTPSRPSNIETVAITTMPTNVPAIAPTILNSPKHFFAPLKPRLKLNTTLANKMLVAASVPAVPVVPPTTPATMSSSNALAAVPQICEPPDIFVANALASPYQRQPMPAATAAPATATKTMKTTAGESTIVASPGSSQRTTSQVSARQLCRRHQQHKKHRQQQQQQQRLLLLLHEQQQRLLRQQIIEPIRTSFLAADTADGVDVDTTSITKATATATATLTTTARTIIPTDNYALPINIKCLTLQQQLTAYVQQLSLPCVTTTTETTPIQVVQSNIFFTKPNEPIYATAHKRCTSLMSATALTKPLMTATTHTTKTPPPQCMTQLFADTNNTTNINTTTTNVTTKDGGVQTDSVNLKSILNEIETISEDILAIQLEKNKSRENLANSDAPVAGNLSLQQQNKNKKPYRSEMNLMLSYNGTNPKITPAITATGTQTSLSSGSSHSARRTRSLEREQTESPSPNVPDPVAPFPDNRTYIGFEQYDQGVIVMKTAPTGAAAPTQKPPLPPPPSQLVAGSIGAEGTVFGSSNLPQKPPPPAPPTRMYPPPLNLRGAALTRAASAGTPPVEKASSQTSLVHGLAPNKSHLYTAIATAAAKRAQFRAAPSHMTRSLDTEFMAAHDGVTEADSPQNVVDENNQITEVIRRKTRRVSIVCGDSNAPTTPERSSPVKTPVQTTAPVAGPLIMHPAMNPATGSCADLSTALTNPALKHLKQSSHSTPNSPHSSRRTHEQAHNEAASASAGSTPHHTGGSRNAHHATSTANGISNGVPTQQRKNSQDSGIHANSTVDLDAAAAAATAARSKCSRRHSDGTVAGGGGGGGGGAQRNSGGSHHHHHHHHQQHNSTILGHNPHHSHHSHQDSNHETGTSISDRNSNSLASSRESSTSFSMRSQRRKISISSHAGGKIPWCGCWGNGCL